MRNLPIVSIIFPNFNGGKQPLECLNSIQKLSYPKSKIEVIVIDNNSVDGSDIRIKKKFPKTRLIKNRQNLGFAKAINQGARIAKGEFLFITNDDIIFDRQSLRLMAEYIVGNSQNVILGGQICFKNNPYKKGYYGYFLNRWTGNIFPCTKPSKEPDWIQGCALFIRKKIFSSLKYFDEGFSLIYFEDVDLCFRARKREYKIKCLPQARFWHGNTVTMNKNKPEKYYQWYKNKFRFILKHMPLINILSILTVHIFLIIPFNIVNTKEGKFIPMIKGFFWNTVNFKETLLARNNG